MQWKAVLLPGTPPSTLDSVTLFYLPKNVAPEVDDVVGDRWCARCRAGRIGAANRRQLRTTPAPTVPDKHSIAVKWKARDANDDDLVYRVYYRADGETRWKQLRDG